MFFAMKQFSTGLYFVYYINHDFIIDHIDFMQIKIHFNIKSDPGKEIFSCMWWCTIFLFNFYDAV